MKMKRHKRRTTTRRIIFSVVALSIAVSMSGCGLRRALDPYANEWLTVTDAFETSWVGEEKTYKGHHIFNSPQSSIKKQIIWGEAQTEELLGGLTNQKILTFFANRGVDQCKVGTEAPLHVICYQLVHDWHPDLAFGYVPLSYRLWDIEIKSPYKTVTASDFLEDRDSYMERNGLKEMRHEEYLNRRIEAEARFLTKFSVRQIAFDSTIPSPIPPRGSW